MKRLLPKLAFTLALAFLLSPAALRAQKVNALIVESTELNTVFLLEKQPVWEPGTEAHTVTYDNQKYQIPNTPDTRINFGYQKPSGLDAASTQKASVRISGHTLYINTAGDDVRIAVVNMAGEGCIVRKVECHTAAEIDLGPLQPGFYVITVGDQTLKYIKK